MESIYSLSLAIYEETVKECDAMEVYSISISDCMDIV